MSGTTSAEREPAILFVGRCFAAKGGPDLVEAFRRVRRTHPRAQLWIVSQGPTGPLPEGAIFHGTVLKIGSLAKFRQSRTGMASGIKVFDVTVKIDEKDSGLKPGLTATLDIIVDHQENVVFVPLPAIVSRKGEHHVFVAHEGKIEERKVVLGPSNEQNIIVQKGLRPGEQLVLGLPPSGPS